ncbi:MAG: MlaD family protein [Bacteroidales bacterium]|nr:MlaD family protein [Bacteroidales bacterium]
MSEIKVGSLKFSKEFRIGFLFILVTAILVWGFSFLKNKNILYKERVIIAVYKHVNGLNPSNPVYINGVKVGQVGKVYFDPSLDGDIIVQLVFTDKFPVPLNSTARIFSEDLMGSKAVEILLGTGPDYAGNGDTLHADVETTLKDAVNQQILPLKLKAEDLLSSIDTMVVAVQGIFNKDAIEDLNASIKSIRHTFSNLENTTQNLDTLVLLQSGRLSSILYNIDMITRNLNNNSDEINRVLGNLATLSDTLAHANISGVIQNIDNTFTDLANVLARIDKGEGTLGLLINNDQLYKDLQKSAFELNQLIEDIRLNPKRYVRVSVF